MTRAGPFRSHALLLLGLLVAPLAGRTQAILANETLETRTFGYVIGDRIRRETHLRLSEDYRLDVAGLPHAGRLNRWLELAEPEVRTGRDSHNYRLIFTYQIVNAPLKPEAVVIPQQDLRILASTDGDTGALTTLVPALEIGVVPMSVTQRVSAQALQQDRPPMPVALEVLRHRLAWSATALLTLLLLAAWQRGIMALVARRKLPFARAVRELRRVQATPELPARDAAGLKVVHAAINRTAGRAVFTRDVDDFLATHPQFAAARDDFERMFAASSGIFFDRAAAPGESIWPVLVRLCRLCSRVEWRTPANSSGDAAR